AQLFQMVGDDVRGQPQPLTQLPGLEVAEGQQADDDEARLVGQYTEEVEDVGPSGNRACEVRHMPPSVKMTLQLILKQFGLNYRTENDHPSRVRAAQCDTACALLPVAARSCP